MERPASVRRDELSPLGVLLQEVHRRRKLIPVISLKYHDILVWRILGDARTYVSVAGERDGWERTDRVRVECRVEVLVPMQLVGYNDAVAIEEVFETCASNWVSRGRGH